MPGHAFFQMAGGVAQGIKGARATSFRQNRYTNAQRLTVGRQRSAGDCDKRVIEPGIAEAFGERLLQRATKGAHHAVGAEVLLSIVVVSPHFFSGSLRLTVVVR